MRVEAPIQAQYALTVVDTNVLLSAALSPGGVPATLVDRLLEIGKLVFSEATFSELEARIWLPKFDRYLPIERRHQLLHLAQASAAWIDIPAALAQRSFCRDPMDDAFIHAAIGIRASRLITGDNDLLCLHPLDRLQILTPRHALDELYPNG